MAASAEEHPRPDDPTRAAASGEETLRVAPGDHGLLEPVTHPEQVPGQDEAALGLHFGPFRVLRELGRGGMGIVYLAEDAGLRRRVALKVLPRGFAASPVARARFRREAEILSKLDHPGLCGILATGETDGVHWLAMRFVKGRTLAEEIRDAAAEGGAGGSRISDVARTRGGWRDAVALVEQVARALHVAHEAGVVHRDFKPANTMITPEGAPVVLDFGLARAADEGQEPALTLSGDVLGTPHYMAPEQIRGDVRRLDRGTDVWALGVTLYEMLALSRPFEAATREALYHAILERDPEPLRRRNPHVPRDLEAVVMTALDKDPARRYQTAAVFADDLRAVLALLPIKARLQGPLDRLAKRIRRKPAQAALVLLLAVAVPAAALLVGAERKAAARSRAALERFLAAAADHLAHERLVPAREALEAARRIDPAAPGLAGREAEARSLAALHEAETVALDPDLDPDGRLATAALAAWRGAHGDDLVIAALEAYVLARTGRGTDAVARLEGFGAAHPESPARALVALLAAEDPVAVAARVEDPGAARLASLVAVLVLSARGRHREALALLERGLEAAPDDAKLAWIGAEEARRFGDHHTALALAGRYRVLAGGLSTFKKARYAAYLRSAGHAEAGLAMAESALAADPDHPVLLLAVASALADCRRPEEAVRFHEKAIARAPDLPEAWAHYGATLQDLRRHEEAAAAAEKAVQLRPDFADGWLNYGNALLQSGRATDAEPALRKALALKPDFPLAHNSLGVALRALGRLDEAQTAHETALRLKPDHVEAIVSLGSLLAVRGERAAAAARYRQALAIAPKDARAAYNLALLLHDQEPAEAMRLYRLALESDPEDSLALTNLAHLVGAAGSRAEALDLARRACAADPADPVAWNTLGTLSLESGAAREAADAFRRAAVLDPRAPEPHYNLVTALRDADPLEARARLVILEILAPDGSLTVGAALPPVMGEDDPLVTKPARPEDHRHPLFLALRALAGGPLAEEAMAGLAASALGLPEGTPGDRDAVLRRAAIEKALALAEAQGATGTTAAQLKAEAARLDAVPPDR